MAKRRHKRRMAHTVATQRLRLDREVKRREDLREAFRGLGWLLEHIARLLAD